MNKTNECGVWDGPDFCLVPLDKIEMLPCFHRETIPETFLDAMGHMNVRWYLSLFGEAGWALFQTIGLDRDYINQQRKGSFALKQFIQYFAEVRVGQTVGIRTRLLNRSDKRFHFMHFMVNETTGQLASTMEGLGTHADLKLRRSAPMPAEIAVKFDAIFDQHQKLDWEAPACGVIHV